MPCSNVMIKKEKVIKASANNTVAEVLEIFETKGIRSVPVTDEDGTLVGIFNFTHLMKKLLPVLEPASDDDSWLRLKHVNISLDHLQGSTPWVAKRLELLLPRKLEDVMIKDPHFVHEDTPIREGIRMMTLYGSPLPVVDENDQKLQGLVTSQNVVTALSEIAEHVAKGNAVDE